MITQLSINATRQGLHEITEEVAAVVDESGLREGLCTLFIKHTSASLLVQENADPSAARDLEHWLNRFVSENDQIYTHINEGPDDMPSHIKSTLTASSVAVPFVDGRLTLGTWQGIFLWEHRRTDMQRNIIVHMGA